ncbi:MAG: ABC transporter permease subunit [Actinomycetia bacterium]|nr:ABC transporter permease subunit [Actinomycetes bacterium]MCP4963146.1 ABC transporter permease subunit [Actinomycetes bacterium]
MIAAELYKVRTHRTPLMAFAALLAASVIPSIVLIWYTPASSGSYLTAFAATWSTVAVLMSVVFGGWLLGTEYRQDTVKRMLTTQPRRLTALGSKAAVGVSVLSAALVATASIGWLAARLVASMNDVTVAWNGRELLASGVTALIAAAMSFVLSAITKSDSFAMVGTVGTLLILNPLLSLIPNVGKYTFGQALEVITTEIEGVSEAAAMGFGVSPELSLTAAIVTVSAWLGGLALAGTALFQRRDV